MEKKGSFSTEVKKELAELRIKRASDARALLSAFTLGIGSLKLVPERRSWGVHYVIKSKEAVELAAKLASQYYGLECRLTEVQHERLNASYCELMIFGEDIDRFLLETGIMSLDEDGEKHGTRTRVDIQSYDMHDQSSSFFQLFLSNTF